MGGFCCFLGRGGEGRETFNIGAGGPGPVCFGARGPCALGPGARIVNLMCQCRRASLLTYLQPQVWRARPQCSSKTIADHSAAGAADDRRPRCSRARCSSKSIYIYRGPARSAQRCTTSSSITLIGFYCFWGRSSSAVGSFLLFWDAFLVFGVVSIVLGRFYSFLGPFSCFLGGREPGMYSKSAYRAVRTSDTRQQQEHIYRGPARSAQRLDEFFYYFNRFLLFLGSFFFCSGGVFIILGGFSCFWVPFSSSGGRFYRFSRILRENT